MHPQQQQQQHAQGRMGPPPPQHQQHHQQQHPLHPQQQQPFRPPFPPFPMPHPFMQGRHPMPPPPMQQHQASSSSSSSPMAPSRPRVPSMERIHSTQSIKAQLLGAGRSTASPHQPTKTTPTKPAGAAAAASQDIGGRFFSSSTQSSPLSVNDIAINKSTSINISDIAKFPRAFDSNQTGNLIGATDRFIAYGVANGKVRVLAQQTGAKGLVAEHKTAVQDLSFCPSDDTLLATLSESGVVVVRLSTDGELEPSVVARLEGRYVAVRWEGTAALAVSATSIVDVSTALTRFEGDRIVDVASSASRGVFVATADGAVRPLAGGADVAPLVQADSDLTRLLFVGAQDDVLVTLAGKCQVLKTWNASTGQHLSTLRFLQTFHFAAADAPASRIILSTASPKSGFVVVTLKDGLFYHAVFVPSLLPFLSFCSVPTRDDPKRLDLFVVQTKPVQRYELRLDLPLEAPAQGEDDDEDEEEEEKEKEEEETKKKTTRKSTTKKKKEGVVIKATTPPPPAAAAAAATAAEESKRKAKTENMLLKRLDQLFAKHFREVADVMQREREAYIARVQSTIRAEIQQQLPRIVRAELQSTFRSSFEDSIIPSFEGATQRMFAQIHQAIVDNMPAPAEVGGALEGGSDSGQQQAQAPPRDVLAEIKEHMQAEEWEEAFTLALSAGEQTTLMAAIALIGDPDVFLDEEPLSNALLLSLIQQLSFDMTSDTVLKLHWLNELLVAFDARDELIANHVPGIVDQALTNVDQEAVYAADEKLTRRVLKLLKRMV